MAASTLNPEALGTLNPMEEVDLISVFFFSVQEVVRYIFPMELFYGEVDPKIRFLGLRVQDCLVSFSSLEAWLMHFSPTSYSKEPMFSSCRHETRCFRGSKVEIVGKKHLGVICWRPFKALPSLLSLCRTPM